MSMKRMLIYQHSFSFQTYSENQDKINRKNLRQNSSQVL
ncbi:hypothetical protein SK137_0993 [Streptococcus mitis]|nr:hypothetical protein SK137_0993 [Streptococcus mitis]